MSTKNIQIGGSMMSFRQLPIAEPMITAAATRLIWAHGWGLSGGSLGETANHATHLGDAILVDFPGFGQSPPPPIAWSRAAADFFAPLRTIYWQWMALDEH